MKPTSFTWRKILFYYNVMFYFKIRLLNSCFLLLKLLKCEKMILFAKNLKSKRQKKLLLLEVYPNWNIV